MSVFSSTPFIRRVVYLVMAAALVVGVGRGWITLDQADQWQSMGERAFETVLPLIAAGALGVAAKKANAAADDPSTVADVEAARDEARRVAVQEMGSIVEAAVGRATGHVESVLAPYVGPTSH